MNNKVKIEEDKIDEENEIVDSYSAQFEKIEKSPAKNTPVIEKSIHSPINPEIEKKYNKTETLMQNKKSNLSYLIL